MNNKKPSAVGMTAAQVADEFVACAKQVTYASHGDLLRHFADATPLRGQLMVVNEEFNVAYFVWCSQLFVDAITALIRERPPRVVTLPCHQLVALTDGVSLPGGMSWVGSRLPKQPYKKTHFLPMQLVPYSAAVKDHPRLAKSFHKAVSPMS
jgi:hypothetical protein